MWRIMLVLYGSHTCHFCSYPVARASHLPHPSWSWGRDGQSLMDPEKESHKSHSSVSRHSGLGSVFYRLYFFLTHGSNTWAIWCEELTHWKRPWCWERLRAGGEGGNRGWDGWMASLTQWTWVWANPKRWWRTGKPGLLQSMGSQRLGLDLVVEQQQRGSVARSWVLCIAPFCGSGRLRQEQTIRAVA